MKRLDEAKNCVWNEALSEDAWAFFAVKGMQK